MSSPNTQLLTTVRDFIKRNPEEYDQGSWYRCISGLALTLSDATMPGSDDYYSELPALLLGLDAEQASSLFSINGWPDPYADELLSAIAVGDTQRAAAAAVGRIDHFLAAVVQEVAHVC